MTVNDFLQSTAKKLRELFPDAEVYADQIPQNADGGFFIRAVDATHKKELGRRVRRDYQFEVVYFLRDGGPLAFNDWAETMMQNFEQITVGGQVYHLRDLRTQDDSEENKLFRVLFSCSFSAVKEPDPRVVMERLEQREALKE